MNPLARPRESASETTTLPSLIWRHAAARPSAPAIIAADLPMLSYAALIESSAAIGRTLQQAGIGPESRVAVQLASGAQLARILVAVMSHAIAVPLDPRLTKDELERLRGRLHLDAIVTDGSVVLPAARPFRRIALEEGSSPLSLFVSGAPGAAAIQREATPDALALVLHTSGTTAQPKLVPLTHENIVARAQRLQGWLGLTQDDRALAVAPLHYAHGLETALFAPLAIGASLACPPPLERSESPLRWLEDLEPTYYSAGPAVHRMLLDRTQSEAVPRHRLRLIQSAGAPIPERDRSALERAFGVPVLDAYGLSETGQLAANAWDASRRRPGTVGMPYEGFVALRSEEGALVPLMAGEQAKGEILARGPNVIPGYLGDDGTLMPAAADGWFSTGDLGTIDRDGFLTLSGRMKDIVNRGGEKIAPAEVDQALLRHPEVSEAAAFAVPHPRLGEDLAAAVVLRPGSSVTALDLRRYLAERLLPFKVPRRIHLLPQLPRGNTGKISRRALSQEWAARDEPAVQVQLRSPLELEIVRLWKRLLKRDAINATEDFFELGGDSLLAVEMRLELESLIGRPVPEALLFDAATPRQLANAILADDFGLDGALLPLRREGSKQPFLFFHGDFAGGGLYMRRIGALLDPERPVWLLRPFEVADGRVPSIEDMARHHLTQLRDAGFRPPYLFGGHCNGALVALEAARQAEAAGEAVSLVVLIDPVSLNARWPLRAVLRGLRLHVRLTSRKALRREERLGRAMSTLWGLIQDTPWNRLKRRVRGQTRAAIAVPDEFDRRHEQRAWTYRASMARHLPGRVEAKLLCLSASTSSRRFFSAEPWARFGSAVEAVAVPGGHLSCLTDGAEDLAAALRRGLEPF